MKDQAGGHRNESEQSSHQANMQMDGWGIISNKNQLTSELFPSSWHSVVISIM